jgi:hypothetical protein
MISTVYGNSKAFKANTLKPTQDINDPDGWAPLEYASNYKIALPAAGVWKISIATDENSINFYQIEGDAPWEPIEFTENPTEIIIDATAKINDAWDAQFWVYTDEVLPKGTETTISFKYKMESADLSEATVGTQCHAAPGAYLHWAAIGDVTFTDEWQTFEKTFTVPNEGDNMQSIAFNLSQDAPVKFYIKDFIWGYSNHKASLIDMESGDKNFYIKEGKTPDGAYQSHLWGTDPIFVENEQPANPFDIAGGEDGGPDGVVDVSDLQMLINYITGAVEIPADFKGFNTEEDEIVDVSDLQLMINEIVKQ